MPEAHEEAESAAAEAATGSGDDEEAQIARVEVLLTPASTGAGATESASDEEAEGATTESVADDYSEEHEDDLAELPLEVAVETWIARNRWVATTASADEHEDDLAELPLEVAVEIWIARNRWVATTASAGEHEDDLAELPLQVAVEAWLARNRWVATTARATDVHSGGGGGELNEEPYKAAVQAWLARKEYVEDAIAGRAVGRATEDDEEVIYEATHIMAKEMIAQEALAEAGQDNTPEECNQKIEFRELEARPVQEKQKLDPQVAKLRDEITCIKEHHATEVRVIKQQHAAEVVSINEEHAAEVKRINEEHAAKIKKLADEIQVAKKSLQRMSQRQSRKKYDGEVPRPPTTVSAASKFSAAKSESQAALTQALLEDEQFLQQLKTKMGLSSRSRATVRARKRSLVFEDEEVDENDAQQVDLNDEMAALMEEGMVAEMASSQPDRKALSLSIAVANVGSGSSKTSLGARTRLTRRVRARASSTRPATPQP